MSNGTTVRRVFGFVLLAMLVWHVPAFAQLTTGTISGTVIDQTKATLPGAEVNVRNVGTGLVRTVFANDNGRFEAPNLPIGQYEVTAALQGFGTAVRRDLQLTVGRTIVVELMLPLASVSQEVIVTGAAPLVEVTSATVSNLIDARRVEDLPLVNRDLTQLTYLQPGVIRVPSSGSQGVFSGMGDKFTVAGARGTQNLYLLDGVSNADLSGNAQGSSGAMMGAETVQEIQIVTNNYSAEYRSAAGGIVSAVTKSGTNTFSGSVFEFYRNDALDAANYFDKQFRQPKPDFERNQFGFSLGGPIARNKLFFFGSYEGLRDDLGKTDTALVPSVNARQGRLANGRIVAVSPAMAPYLALYPVPGQGNSIVQDFGDTVLIAGALSQATDNDFVLGKIDYQAAGGHTLSGTYNFDRGERSPFGIMYDVTGQPSASGIAQTGTRSTKHVFGSKWTAVLSGASLNELHFGYSDSEPAGELPLTTRDFASQGLLFRPDRQRMGQIDVPGVLTSLGFRVDPTTYQQRAYAIKEGYSLIRGNHSYRLGGEWTYYRYDINSCTRGCNGIYEFRNLESLLTATVRRFDVMVPGGDDPYRDLRQHLLGVYFQDNWQVRSDVTLNLGLRYEFASVPTEVDGKSSNLIRFTDPNVTIGPLFENPTAKSVSPRVGVVWAPQEGRMSIRGGFGIFYEHPMLYNIRTSLQELPPFTLVGRIEGSGINFPNAFATQLSRAGARPNIRTMQYELDQTTYYRWSAGVQRQLGTNWVVSADYTGTRGFHLWHQTLANLRKWEGWPAQPAGEKYFPPNSPLINPNFGEMRIQYSDADLWYQGGSLAVQRRLSDGLQMGASFTYSKAIDEGSGVTSNGDELPQSQRGIYGYDMHLKKGPAAYDIPKVFSANVSYELPFGRNLTGAARALASGWQINSIISLMDGYPLSVEELSDAQATRLGDDENLRPDLIAGGNSNPVTGDPERWFDISQFTPSRLGYFGNLGKGTVRSPGLATVDLSVFKNVEVGRGRLQFRIETFNLFNRTNFGTPDMVVFIDGRPNPTAGRITTTRTPARQAQIGVRWVF
ncbi:MAG: TonB-dependent receptor [Acidobacteria bacterium]|nr:TonB-dependent receptor [Acidobacteriota bacterium]